MRDPNLWARVTTFAFDTTERPGTFVCRLAQAAGWSTDYAHAVAEEYRRFLYLATISDYPLTPSPAVNVAWHLHVSSAPDYWDRLCKEVLKFPLDLPRYPVTRDRQADQYDVLYELYEQEFGCRPPVNVWPITLWAPQLKQLARATATVCCSALLGLVALPVSAAAMAVASTWLTVGLLGAVVTSGVTEA